MAAPGVEAKLATLAGRQHGVVARAQLREIGLESGAIGRRLRAGRLHRLHPGVYAVGHRVLTREGRWLAAVLACGAGAALSHRSAAALWEIGSYSGEWIEVTLPRKSRSLPGIRRHFARLQADEVTVHEGIPVTSVPRTIFDLAANHRPELVESALREAEFRRLFDRLSLPQLLDRHPRAGGAKVVRECLARLQEDPEGRIRSSLEERFLPFVDRHRLPRPRFNAWIEAGGRWHQVDCLWPAQRQVAEMDGWGGHGTRRAFREDRARDRRLRVAGYGVTRLTWDQLDDEPEEVARDLRGLLRFPATRTAPKSS